MNTAFTNNKLKYLKYLIAAIVLIYILYVMLVALISNYTYRDLYRVEPLSAEASDQEKAVIMAKGLTYALDGELNNFVGLLTNDLFFVPNYVDNRSSYQRGVIYATRPGSDILAKTIARFGERDTIDQRLADATSRYFTYGENVWGFWFIYGSEGKYQQGIENWFRYAQAVGKEGKGSAIYNIKSDDVYSILKYCVNMTDYALGVLNDDAIGHFSSDNAIYYAKGISAVTANILRAISTVDRSVGERGGAENLHEALRRFDYIAEFKPSYIFAGGNTVGDAMLPNHVAAIARHIDIANSRLNDMLKSMEK